MAGDNKRIRLSSGQTERAEFVLGAVRSRHGTALYITVLSNALIVSLLGLGGLVIVRVERNQMAVSTDRGTARMNANSAVELALSVIADDSNWRTTYTNGVETAAQTLGSNSTGTLSWILEDSDGSLIDADTDLQLKGVGRVGSTVQVSTIKIQDEAPQSDYLRTVVHAGGLLSATGTINVTGGPLSSNASLDILSDAVAINSDAEAPAYSGNLSLLTGTFTATPPKSLPPSTVLDDTYKPLSTEIVYSSLPQQGGFRKIAGELSATSNPYSQTNSEGIYYIYIPASGKLKFVDFTLTGTLLVEVEAGGAIIGTTILGMQPHSPNYATMVIKMLGAGVTLDLSGDPGVSSSGLIHLTGVDSTFKVGQNFNHTGTIVSDADMVLGKKNKSVTFIHDPSLHANPPLGYATNDTSSVDAVPGTWIWDANPVP